MDEPAHNHFPTSLRQQIDGGELLKYSHRVGGTQNRDSAGETDTLRSCRRCSENDRRSGIEELPAVMLTHAKGVQSHLIGVFDLFDEVAQTVRRAYRKTAVVESGCEAVDSNLHFSSIQR
jgi:hypothetical protein